MDIISLVMLPLNLLLVLQSLHMKNIIAMKETVHKTTRRINYMLVYSSLIQVI